MPQSTFKLQLGNLMLKTKATSIMLLVVAVLCGIILFTAAPTVFTILDDPDKRSVVVTVIKEGQYNTAVTIVTGSIHDDFHIPVSQFIWRRTYFLEKGTKVYAVVDVDTDAALALKTLCKMSVNGIQSGPVHHRFGPGKVSCSTSA